ncbi:MAG: pentapeptide repeat-containing protein [Candidatus Thiodiazotropha sp. (ex Lucinoma borealis)]|nr:pentapeptide repeat-containing protein [Candidatus Thiodiazotropha sp. (ex Lucinoma borealis)]
MANPEHLDIIGNGPSVAKEWRQGNPNTGFDLSNADLSNRDLRNHDFSHSNLSGANFSHSDLRGCKLIASTISNANFNSSNLSKTQLNILTDTENADFSNTRIIESNISGCEFNYCNFTKAFILRSNIHTSKFFEVNFHKCSFYELNISYIDFKRSYGIRTSLGLDTLSFETDNVTSFETSIQDWQEKYFNWDKLRTVGKLPLFGASYFALIIIPIYFYGLDIYNQNIELIRDWAALSAQEDNLSTKRFAEFITAKLHPLPVPTRSLAILVSTIFLALGSTFYTFKCPSRIKEFNQDKWVDELNKSLLSYWPLSWKFRYIRLLSALFYFIGGSILFYILLEKLYGVLQYIHKYS